VKYLNAKTFVRNLRESNVSFAMVMAFSLGTIESSDQNWHHFRTFSVRRINNNSDEVHLNKFLLHVLTNFRSDDLKNCFYSQQDLMDDAANKLISRR